MEYTIHSREKFFARAIDSLFWGSVPTEQKEKERREMEK